MARMATAMPSTCGYAICVRVKTPRDAGNFHGFLPIEKMSACICTFSQRRFPLTFADRKDVHSSSHFFTTGGAKGINESGTNEDTH